ncbi:MAG: hypothetical protein PQ612_04865 [Rickettsiales bacterium]|nr:hypothetical protein [Pseudomonadota bacterium]MDA0966352.1 hypothetical protein [Pseudomonadota bacterium]MDG4543984.1 hypothetical protein [Rickettsiales bacterium]MDG4545478.1 hypothetical protein [Rickettsiales bacterium]MDG4547927.1 hypothetical protein [Rickettsiales bacterium]
MKEKLKTIFAFLLIFFIFVFAIINFLLTKYGKEHIELFTSKIFQGDATIGRLHLNFYPPAVGIFDINIKIKDDKSPVKNIKISRIDLGFDKKTLFSELLILRYVKVIEPEIIFDGEALNANPVNKEKQEDVVSSVEVPEIQEYVKPDFKIVDLQNAEIEKSFIISKLDITDGKIVPLGENDKSEKEEYRKLHDIELEKLDNYSGSKINEAVVQELEKALKNKPDKDKEREGEENKAEDTTQKVIQ